MDEEIKKYKFSELDQMLLRGKQHEIAEKIGESYMYVHYIIKGRRKPVRGKKGLKIKRYLIQYIKQKKKEKAAKRKIAKISKGVLQKNKEHKRKKQKKRKAKKRARKRR